MELTSNRALREVLDGACRSSNCGDRPRRQRHARRAPRRPPAARRNPSTARLPTPLSAAFDYLRSIRAQPAHFALSPGPSHLALFEKVCRESDALGDLTPDAYLASLAIEHGAALASLDRLRSIRAAALGAAGRDGLSWLKPTSLLQG